MEADETCDEPLSPVDTACLRIEDRTSLIVNVGAMMFAESLDYGRVKETLEQRLLGFPRFRQRVVFPEWPLGPPHWEDDPFFDLRSHLHRMALPGPGDDQALQELLSDLISTPLNRTGPLWQVHLIENYRNGSVLLFRLHHCLADGMALTQVLRAMTDREPGTPRKVPAPAGRPPPDEDRIRAAPSPLTARVHALLGGTETLLHRGIETLFHPGQGLALAGVASDAAITLGKLLLLEPDSPTVFKGPLGAIKHVAWSPPLPIKEIKAIGRFLGGSVHEVLLTAVTGALRRYLQHRGTPVSDIHLRVSIPVGKRHGASAQALGNRFSLNLLALPIDRGDPAERLAVLRRRLRALERSSEAGVISGLMNLYGMAPAEIGNRLIPLLTKNVTAVVSTIPGPRRTISFAGRPIQRLMFWVPQSGHLGLGLSLLTYADAVTLGVVADAGLVPDPESIVQGFREEIEHLIEALSLPTRAEAAG
jgi:WS/DGAT/MGAT family acyltransferase